MKFFGIEIAKEQRSNSNSPTSDFWYTAINAIQSLAGVPVTPATVLRIAVALACVRVISETIGTLPIKSYRKFGKSREEEDQTDIARIFSHGPNNLITMCDYVEKMVAEILLRGNHYSIIKGKKGVEITELEPVEPEDFVSMAIKIISGRKYLTYYFRDPVTREVRGYLSDEVLHVKGLQCNASPYCGTSVISHAADTFGTALAAERYAASTFKNQGMPAGILEYPEGLDEDEVKNIIDSWQRIYGGSENAGKIAILEHGMKYQKIGLSPQDTQLLETRKFSGVLLCGMFRVPPHKVAIMDKATWGNIEHQNIEFSTDCIRPMTVKIEQAIKVKLYGFLALDSSKFYSRFNTEALLRGDIKTRYSSYAIGRQWGWLSSNEIREKEDMNPIEDGDIYLTPLNMIPADLAYETSEPTEDKPESDEPDQEDKPESDENLSKFAKAGINETRKCFTELFDHSFVRLLRSESGNISDVAKKAAKGEGESDLLEKTYRDKIGLRMSHVLSPICEAYSQQMSVFIGQDDKPLVKNLARDTLNEFIMEYSESAQNEIKATLVADLPKKLENWVEEKSGRQTPKLMQELETAIFLNKEK